MLNGDCRVILTTLPEKYFDCCVTSPPYWGLRDYNVEDQLGLEDLPDSYVQNLVEVFREVRRVLRDDATLWLNLGDCYAGGGNYRGVHSLQTLTAKQRSNRGSQGLSQVLGPAGKKYGLAAKQLIGIPWRVAFALQQDGWWLRSDIIWAKPNCMVESIRDRPTRSHEYIFLLAKSQKYYYDYESVKEPAIHEGRVVKKYSADARNGTSQDPRYTGFLKHDTLIRGRNRRDVWAVTVKPFKGAHFATFPPDLIEPCILAGSRKGGTVLDPFAGAGTTLLVANTHGRNAIGIELNKDYVSLAEKRLRSNR
mgnify:FL=1